MSNKNTKSANRRIIITGGGTAGHIYPAVSIIEYIKEKYPDTAILFIGTKKGMEKDSIGELGIEFRAIRSAGLGRSDNFIKKLYIYFRFFFLLISGSARSSGIIKRFRPDFILGMGGYVCGPVFLGAKLLGKKIMIHEQNFIPGRLNRFFARYAELVFVSFDASKELLGFKDKNMLDRVIVSGNPVRKEIRDFAKKTKDFKKFGLEEGRFTVAAFGGSLGAENINSSVLELYKYYNHSSKIQFLLICGERFYPDMKEELYNYLGPSDKLVFRLFPYIKNIADVYRITDLIISRAGATTIAELSVTGIPAILVPYPEAVENHQFYNAKNLVEQKKAIIINDRELNGDSLHASIQLLLENNKEKYVNMKEAALKPSGKGSEEIIVEKLFCYA